MSTFSFNPNNVQDTFAPVPAGEYIAQVSEVKDLTSKAGVDYLMAKFTILDGEFKNRSIFQSFHIYNPNITARNIAQQQLNSLCVAMGFTQAANLDTAQILNRPVRIKVKIREQEGYEPQNQITHYQALTRGAGVPNVPNAVPPVGMAQPAGADLVGDIPF